MDIWLTLTSYISRFDIFRMIPDILIITFVVYQLLKLTKDTRARQVLQGYAIILVASAVSKMLRLPALTWMLDIIISNGVLVLVILFQPELRRVFEQLGRAEVLKSPHLLKNEAADTAWVVEELVKAMVELSRTRTGALILIQRKTGMQDIMESGTRIDGLISAGLLINIFEPDTPLHDAAVILHRDRIIAAGCVLPLSQNANISKDLGTRHRAAIGIAEQTDALAFVVSEETGIISVAQQGVLTRHLDPTSLRALLLPLYSQIEARPNPLESFLKWRKRNG